MNYNSRKFIRRIKYLLCFLPVLILLFSVAFSMMLNDSNDAISLAGNSQLKTIESLDKNYQSANLNLVKRSGQDLIQNTSMFESGGSDSCVETDSSIVAWWPVDENSGTIVN